MIDLPAVTVEEFAEASRKKMGSGSQAKHWIMPARLEINEGRALVEFRRAQDCARFQEIEAAKSTHFRPDHQVGRHVLEFLGREGPANLCLLPV